jgi:hypothetical protein
MYSRSIISGTGKGHSNRVSFKSVIGGERRMLTREEVLREMKLHRSVSR